MNSTWGSKNTQCDWCGNTIFTGQNIIIDFEGRFCSNKCKAEYYNNNKPKYTSTPTPQPVAQPKTPPQPTPVPQPVTQKPAPQAAPVPQPVPQTVVQQPLTAPRVVPAPQPAPKPIIQKTPPKPAAAPGQYVIGDTGPAGGIIFHDKGVFSDGWRYLEAAPKEIEFSAKWDEAVQKCKELKHKGFSNWILPNKNDLQLMYLKLSKIGLVGPGGLESAAYWSSTEYSKKEAWYCKFGAGGGFSNSAKIRIMAVCAIRSF